MNAQQLHDYIINPSLVYMGNNYNSKDARMLLLATAAIESNCGYYVKQINGPAQGIWQMEPKTCSDILKNSDIMQDTFFKGKIYNMKTGFAGQYPLIDSPLFACAMARLKYSMDTAALPHHLNQIAIWRYYKRIFNTVYGAATEDAFNSAWQKHKLTDVEL